MYRDIVRETKTETEKEMVYGTGPGKKQKCWLGNFPPCCADNAGAGEMAVLKHTCRQW